MWAFSQSPVAYFGSQTTFIKKNHNEDYTEIECYVILILITLAFVLQKVQEFWNFMMK